jgi:hypothetical protein
MSYSSSSAVTHVRGSYRGVGMGALGEVAGEIGGVAALEHDIRLTSAAMRRQWGTFAFNQGVFDGLMARAGRGELTQLTPNEAKQFVAGVVNRVIEMVVKMRQLAAKDVPDAAARERVQSGQATLLRVARNLWNEAGNALRNARPASAAAGLGIVWFIPIIAGIVIMSLVGGGVYLGAQYLESSQALDAAERLCHEYPNPPCTAERAAAIAAGMRTPDAMTVFADRLGTPLGIGLAVGGGVVVLGGGIWLWRKFR